MATKETAVRKRQQIAKANRMMFLWVAGASVIIGFAAVGSIFLIQTIAFNQKVINEKNKTVATLKDNNAAVEELRNNIRLLNTNEDLSSIKAKSEDSALQVVLDALPADANSLALGSSLQNKLISGIDGLTLDSLNVMPIEGSEVLADESVEDASVSDDRAATTVSFTMTVSTSDPTALKQLLERFEKSIRAISIQSLVMESSGGTLSLTIDASAFYEPARTVELKDKVVKP